MFHKNTWKQTRRSGRPATCNKGCSCVLWRPPRHRRLYGYRHTLMELCALVSVCTNIIKWRGCCDLKAKHGLR